MSALLLMAMLLLGAAESQNRSGGGKWYRVSPASSPASWQTTDGRAWELFVQLQEAGKTEGPVYARRK